MELWYTEEWTDNVRLGIKVKSHLYTAQSKFQKVDIMDSEEFQRQFDCVFYNDYDAESEDRLVEMGRRVMGESNI